MMTVSSSGRGACARVIRLGQECKARDSWDESCIGWPIRRGSRRPEKDGRRICAAAAADAFKAAKRFENVTPDERLPRRRPAVRTCANGTGRHATAQTETGRRHETDKGRHGARAKISGRRSVAGAANGVALRRL